MLVHGFPEFWWTWRSQIPALAAAGYRVAAMDLRGFGASDKPPSGYDAQTACDDIAALIRSLGADQAAIVGHGLGGWFAWSMPGLHPEVTAAIGSVGMPHPSVFRKASWRHPRQWKANDYIRALQTPFAPERHVAGRRSDITVRLAAWSGPDTTWLAEDVTTRYATVMSVPFAPQAAAHYYRWVVRSRVTAGGWSYSHRVRRPITVPVLQVQGALDSAVLPSLANHSARYVHGPLQLATVPGVGHFVQEEAPETMNDVLLTWLDGALPKS